MANQLNDFDRLIKETYENQEFAYDASAWDGIEQELSMTTPGMLDFFKSVTTGLTIAGAVFATMLIFTTGSGNLTQRTENQKIISGNGSTENSVVIETPQSNNQIALNDSSKDDVKQDDSNSEPGITSNQSKIESEKSVNNNFTSEQKSTVVAVLAEAKKISTSDNLADVKNNEENSSASVKIGCTGLTIDFDAPEEYGSNAKYLWNFGDGYFSNEENPTHAFNKEGIFDVSLSVTAVGSGQISSNVVQAMIEVHEAPEARFELEINSMTEIKLKDVSMNAVEYAWIVDSEEKLSKDSDVLLSIADNTKYDVELVAENAGDCSDSLAKEIHIIRAGNQFPQLYSSAYASDFAPGAIVDNGEVSDFRIFKKSSGEEVFKSAGSKGWNGKGKNGEEVDKGEYKWMMIVDSQSVFNIYHGNLSVR